MKASVCGVCIRFSLQCLARESGHVCVRCFAYVGVGAFFFYEEEFSQKLGGVLKNKWKNLRDTFRSELKKTRAERSGDQGGLPPFQSNWSWYELMTFLTDIMTPRKTKTNVHHSKRTASQHDDVPFSPALTEKECVSPDETNQASSSRLTVSSEASSLTHPTHKPKQEIQEIDKL
ncbi:uncharacterized protein LOC126416046 [Schistocerca serialis cubense]|uniref:uncharacterized protein LOC126416046 n=1 Tax=Schistocerca serialis cubense TaxID=2023355 RepID=UPI00214E595B|nr:uncharacterized protein LOC126416046 [Schistocerca serialis cubense]